MKPYVHPKAICETKHVGEMTRIWAFTHILKGAVIGKDCNICDYCFIENDVVIGDRVTVKCGVQLWDGLRVENDVFIGPNVTFMNDRFPRSKAYQEKIPSTTIMEHASIGANATILPGIVIGRNAMIGAGSVVTRDVPPNAIVVGNPAYISGYVDSMNRAVSKALTTGNRNTDQKTIRSQVKGVSFHRLPLIKDLRGMLTVGVVGKDIPFVPKRYFIVFGVPSKEVRGEHAHKKCHQFLVCINGSCSVMVDDGKKREEFSLDEPNIGVYIPPMVWGVQYKYSSDAALLVFASDEYDTNDYIRDYQVFLDSLRH